MQRNQAKISEYTYIGTDHSCPHSKEKERERTRSKHFPRKFSCPDFISCKCRGIYYVMNLKNKKLRK